MEEQIRALLAPIAREYGVDVLQVSLGGGHHRQLLRVIVDKTGGVNCEAIERISRALSLQLDAADLIRGRYHLEVSSPGFNWPLTTEADFHRHEGEWLKVSMADGSSLEGKNLGAAEGGFRLLDEQGTEQCLSMHEVVKVVRAVNWKETAAKRKKRK